MNQWYMHNPVPLLEDNTHEFLWYFDIQADPPNLGQKTRPNNNQQKRKKEKLKNCRFYCPS